MWKPRLIRAFALGFILFIIAVVVIADRGEGNDWWPFLGRIPFGDKAGHVGLFGTLALLCNLAFPNRRPSAFITKTTLVLLAIISLEEISQAFIPGRTLDLSDWLADLLGLACGQTLALAMLRKLRPSL
jgi:VanZ family protein